MNNKMFLSLTLAFTFSLSAFAQQDNENKYLGYIYQQQKYQLEDPKGDLLLLWTAHQIPGYIRGSLNGTAGQIKAERTRIANELLLKYPEFKPPVETENIVVEEYSIFNKDQLPFSLEGHKAPFKVSNVVAMMKEVITEEYQQSGIVPTYGTVHKWSPGTIKEMHKKFFFFSRMSKLLVALSRGGSSQYLMTGTEDLLKKEIIAKPEKSIALADMLRMSYRINKGDMYLTFLTIENVLSRFWMEPHRQQRVITTKLKDITNFYYSGDKFGSWYHLFGIILYGYAEGSLKSQIVGRTETLGSHIMGRFQDEKQEDYINRKGGRIGAQIKRFVKNKGYENFTLNPKLAEESSYMQLDEDFSKRLLKAQAKDASEKAETKNTEVE